MNPLWSALFNRRLRKNILKIGRKMRNNRNMLWTLLTAIGLGTAVLGVNKNKNKPQPLQNLMNNLRSRRTGNLSNRAIMELAKEIDPKIKLLTDK